MPLTQKDLGHFRIYLPPKLIESLTFEHNSPSDDLIAHCIEHLHRLSYAILPHLPVYLSTRLIQNLEPGQIWGEFIQGTLLFADISGFTTMSEALSQLGQEGAEIIMEIVNRYFKIMLDILQAYQGELIKFGGDAMLGLFSEPDSAARALQAALEMQAAMDTFAEMVTPQGIFQLEISIGVQYGQFFRSQLGTVEAMEYALFGPDVEKTAITEGLAGPGQVVLDQKTYQEISFQLEKTPHPDNDDYLIVQKILSSEPAVTAPLSQPIIDYPLTPALDNLRKWIKLLDTMTPYLAAGLLNRLASDPGDPNLEGEHRLVAILFVHIQGLGHLVNELGPGQETKIIEALNTYFAEVAQVVYRFGGVINKIDLDKEGNKLLAFFGAPIAHVNDVEHAVRAALALQTSLESLRQFLSKDFNLDDLSLSQKIGINYGHVFVGYVGTDWRREYTVMGDEVNLAARLMEIADPNSILVSKQVKRKVEDLFEFGEKRTLKLKGIRDSIDVFPLEGLRLILEFSRGLPGINTPMINRRDDRKVLIRALRQVQRGQGQIISVLGEMGLGKSRLVEEARKQIDDQPDSTLRWLTGHCLSYTESVSYHPFRELVQGLIGIRLSDEPQGRWSKLTHYLETKLTPKEAGDIQPYLANFLNLPLDDSLQNKIDNLSAEAIQHQIFIAIKMLLEREGAGSGPLVLVLEDIHWVDQASQALLSYLLPMVNNTPIALILVYRPSQFEDFWRLHTEIEVQYSHCFTRIALKPLSDVDSEILLDKLLPLKQWSDKIRDLILERAEGNPLYLEELVRTLIDNNNVKKVEGGWQLVDINIIIPDTLEGVIMSRISRLPGPCLQLIQAAAVIGRQFSLDLLRSILPEQIAQNLRPYLIYLQNYELIKIASLTPEPFYAFRATLCQEVCYQNQQVNQRQRNHRQIAAYLVRQAAYKRNEVETLYPSIANHAYKGQNWTLALEYQILTGKQAHNFFANEEAIQYFNRALETAQHIAQTESQRLFIHGILGDLFTTTGAYDQAGEHLQKAWNLALNQQDLSEQVRLCRLLAQLEERKSKFQAALLWAEQGLGIPQREVTREAAELNLRAGMICIRQGNLDRAFDYCQTGLDLAQRLEAAPVLARAYNLFGIISLRLGHRLEAIENFQQALSFYIQAGDIYGQATAHNLLATAQFDLEQWGEAERSYRWAREIFDQLGDVYRRSGADNNLGGVALKQGRLDEAIEIYETAIGALQSIEGGLHLLGLCHMNLGAAYIQRGDFDVTLAHLTQSKTMFEEIQAREFLAELYRHLAETKLKMFDLAAAKNHGEVALTLARELSLRGEEGLILRILGEIAAARKDFLSARGSFEESSAIFEALNDGHNLSLNQAALANLPDSAEKVE